MEGDTAIMDTLHINLGDKKNYIIKDELAMLDILASNLWKRPIYWAVTCREDKLLGMENYLRLEGLGLRHPGTAARLMQEHQGGRADHSPRLWALLVLCLWAQEHGVA